jgi:hypothetical protein
MGLPALDLVLHFGLENRWSTSFVQLLFKRPAGAVEHSPALDGRTLADFFRPSRQVFVFVRLQELVRITPPRGGAGLHNLAMTQVLSKVCPIV